MPTKGPTGRHRIVIIEDNATDAAMLRRVIEDAGYSAPRVVSDGLDGLNSCLEEQPDLLFLDLDLPRLHGEEILRMLRSATRVRRFPIVIISELEAESKRELELLRLGANHYTTKPYRKSEIVGLLHQLLNPVGTETEDNQRPSAGVSSDDFIKRSLSSFLDESTSAPAGISLGEEAGAKGHVFNGFEIQEVIGSGGMGTVYRAVQQSLGRTVALKVLLKTRVETEEMVQRFRQEARIMASLSHRNILQVIDAGDTAMTLYIAMEYIEGGTLHDRIRRRSIDLPEFMSICTQVCNALIYLHGQGIIHRDIKPGNIFLTGDNSVKVGDFGISRAHFEQDRRRLAETTQRFKVLGTPSFMAPEITVGEEASELSDQYSLGKTLLRLLLPKARKLNPDLLAIHRQEVPDGVREALRRSTELAPEDRFPSILAMKDAIISAGRSARPAS